MKSRFLLFNIVVLLLYIILLLAYHNYDRLKDIAIGETSEVKLKNKEDYYLEKISTIKLSVYSGDTNELNQVRNDIMVKFQESDFQSITIQPKASFIDSLLEDSKLKEYMNKSNLKKSNKSLLNEMKLYLPNELLISFLPKSESIELILSIEDYLKENGYGNISGSNIPTVKSNIKHYYYDRNMFAELITNFSNLSMERSSLSELNSRIFNIEIALMILLFMVYIAFIQILDKYLHYRNLEKLKFLFKGHIITRKYLKQIVWYKLFSLILILVFSGIYLINDLGTSTFFKLDIKFIIFIALTCITNLLLFFFKKERIDL